MLSNSILQRLTTLGIEASHTNDFISGIKLLHLVLEVFYQGENQPLACKMRLSEDQKTGINVLNVNIILNHLKKDPNIHLPPEIKDLTAFKIIQQEEAMLHLIQWILSQKQQSQKSKILKQQMSPPRQQENQFENFYFVSSLDKNDRILNDSLQQQNPREQVVRKGSVKVLRPKSNTASKQSVDQNSRDGSCSSEKRQQISSNKEPLREIVQVHNNITVQNQDRDDLQCRKTIPKMYEKPPLYRSKQKERANQQKQQKKEPTPETTKRLIDREQILQNIENINKKIIEEEKSLSLIPDEAKGELKTRKPSRKIFKMDIPQIDQSKKKTLVSWLISINLLNANSTKYVTQLQDICKDGVVYIQVVNYYRGRGKQLCYFKQPKRPAQIHSNYQRLFAFLNQQVDFRSQLLHHYEYFVPEAQHNAFWSMLSSIYQCFNRRVQPRKTNIHRYEQTINNKIQRQSSKKRQNLNQSASYNDIKYNSASLKKDTRSNSSSAQLPRKTTPAPNRQPTQNSQNQLQKSVVPYGLVQNEQPNEENIFRTERGGYKEMYLCKFKNMQTPQKNRSFHNSSLSKSRLRLSVGSSKKKQSKPVLPSINLQMQMKVLKYLEQFQLQDQNQGLFKDLYRNGVLMCQVVKKSLGIQCTISRRPKSIEDCRYNFMSAIETIKSHKQHFNTAYQSFVEDLVKGQRTLLYGLIWQAIREDDRECNAFNASIQLYNKTSSQEDGYLSWIRSIERNFPDIGAYKIRNEECLFTAITSTDFLFRYSWFITGKKAVTPTYQRPINAIQKQSNLKKVLGYLVQCKIIRSDYLWKAKHLCKEDSSLLRQLVSDLTSHYSHLYKKQQTKTVNFVKYLKREDSQTKERYKEKLQTTMANQSLQQPQHLQAEPPKLQIQWMRKLGFTGNLQLNNGVILCRLMAKLNMKTIQGFNDRPQSKAQCLGNIRKAIKNIPKFRWDEYDILECDYKRTLEIYSFIKDRYKHAYAMKGI